MEGWVIVVMSDSVWGEENVVIRCLLNGDVTNFITVAGQKHWIQFSSYKWTWNIIYSEMDGRINQQTLKRTNKNYIYIFSKNILQSEKIFGKNLCIFHTVTAAPAPRRWAASGAWAGTLTSPARGTSLWLTSTCAAQASRYLELVTFNILNQRCGTLEQGLSMH